MSLRAALLAGLLILCPFAQAHDDHVDFDAVQLLQNLEEEDFFLGGLADGEKANTYVVLPDGQRFALDSETRLAAAKIGSILSEVDSHEHDEVREGLWNRVRAKIADMGVMLTTLGINYFNRFGPATAAVIVAFEAVDPVHGALCPIIQATCVAGSSVARRTWNTVRYRYPLNKPVGDRVDHTFREALVAFKTWRSMRMVFQESEGRRVLFPKRATGKYLYDKNNPAHKLLWRTPFWNEPFTNAAEEHDHGHEHAHDHGGDHGHDHGVCHGHDCDHDHAQGEAAHEARVSRFAEEILDPSRSEMERYFLAKDRVAFLELQLTLAKQAVESVRSQSLMRYFRLHAFLSRYGRALDRYALVLSGVASSLPHDGLNAKDLGGMDERFRELPGRILRTLEADSEAPEFWSYPKDLLQELKQYQKTGLFSCASGLTGFEELAVN
jgi:hypothetical protein